MLGIIVPIILIVLSLGVIGFLIYKRYSEITLLDIDTVPEIREAKKKYELVKRRLAERSKAQGKKSSETMLPFNVQWKRMQERFRNYVNYVAEELRKEKSTKEQEALEEMPVEAKKEKVQALIQDAERAIGEEEYEFAEKCYIEAARIHPHAANAYKGLAEVYLHQGQLHEAKETFHFLHQLKPEDDSVLLKLASIAEEQEDIKTAVDYYEQALLINDSHAVRFAKLGELLGRLHQPQTALEAWHQAVELEPQNPKYLDNLIETAIMVEQKEIAQKYLQELRRVNPENKKITVFQDKIRLLGEKETPVDVDSAM